MKKEDLQLDGKIALAPMAGVSDVGFRTLASRFGADIIWSEMLSCRAMLSKTKKTEYMTVISPEEKIKIGQIFGSEPIVMAQSLSLPMLSQYDIIDINMGCPAPKIFKNGEGSALMNNMPLASKIISACVKAADRPVSVKFRLGVKEDISTQFGRMCEESGASFITLHARTTEMGYSGQADLDAIAKLKASVKIPVIGNGDVVDEKSYQNMLKTGADAVMIGRGSLGRPWIFDLLKGKSAPDDIYAVIKEHLDILRQHYDEKWLTLYMRKHFLWYVSGKKGASEKRLAIATSNNLQESLKIIKDYLK